MANYILPQVLVHQEFNLIPQASSQPLSAHIAGGHAFLARYDRTDEKLLGYLGYYQPYVTTEYPWPNRPVGALVDKNYTKLFIDDALLRYFTGNTGLSTVSGYANRVRSSSLSFASNGPNYPHSAVFKDRGVKIGDIVKAVTSVGGTEYTLWSYVAGFVGKEVPATIDTTPDADAGNANTQTAPSPTYVKLAGAANCVMISNVNASAYNGLATGDINETYTIEVIQSSTGGNASTARLRVTSASGRDDVASVTPAAFGSFTDIGTRGLKVKWTNTSAPACSLSAVAEEVSPVDFVVGQKWRVTCGQAYTKPTVAAGGTYTGVDDMTYIVEVIKGGTFTSGPQISVRTTKGTDMSGPTTVSASGVAVPIGTYGVTITFTGTALCGRDRFYVAVTAKKEGAYQTLVLGHNFAKEVVNASPVDVSLELYIKENVELPRKRLYDPPNVSWAASDTTLTVYSGAQVYTPQWTDGGVQKPLPVYSSEDNGWGKLYVHYRAWLSSLAGNVGTVYDVGELDGLISGPLHPDNPLKWGVYCALLNANGVPVRYTSVANPDDPDSWLAVLSLLDGREDVYGLVPLTTDSTVLGAYIAHVGAQSAPEQGRWRVCWLQAVVKESIAKVSAATSTDGQEVLATIEDDPLVSGTQYTLLSVPARNSAFIDNKVMPGDVVRINYTTDGFGDVSYKEYVVDAVMSQDSLRLRSGPSAAITVPEKIEVWHARTADEQADAVAKDNSAYMGNRRVRLVWPDVVGTGGVKFAGYHLAAALAGLSSGVAPHQGLTNLEIAGFDDLDRTTVKFNRSQLDRMAGAGVWIVTKDPKSGVVYTRDALTTGDYNDIHARQESVVRNVDSVSYYFLNLLKPFIGTANVTPSTIDEVRAAIQAGLMELASRNFVRRLGTQIIGGKVLEVRQHALLKDRIVAAVNLEIPYALGVIELHLVV